MHQNSGEIKPKIKKIYHFGHIDNQGTYKNDRRKAGEEFPSFGAVQSRASAHRGIGLIRTHGSLMRRQSSYQRTGSSMQESMALASNLEAWIQTQADINTVNSFGNFEAQVTPGQVFPGSKASRLFSYMSWKHTHKHSHTHKLCS